MTVFKAFLKIINKNKFIILLYTIILLIFGCFNMKSQEQSLNFTASKPNILIINEDEATPITESFIQYISDNSNRIEMENEDEKIDDALFYREVNYVIYIPKNYSAYFLQGLEPELKVKSSGDYQASLAEMIVERYIKIANIYRKNNYSDIELIQKIKETLEKETSVEITSALDTNALEKATFYFNFESYSLLACLIYVICLILSAFNNENIKKRTIISSCNYKKNNRILLFSNCLYAIIIWLFYLILAFFLIGNIMFTRHGLVYAINSFLFTFCATTLAFCIGSLIQNKDAITGIVNVFSLGSSFLCGAFVPLQWLPDSVLKIAHLLPTYYYIKTNESLTSLEVWNTKTITPLLINMSIIIAFSIFFIILTNRITKKKRKIG